MKLGRIAIILLITLCIVAPNEPEPTVVYTATVLQKSLKELIDRSETILYGKCVSTETIQEGKFTFNLYTIIIEQVLKGDEKLEEVKFRQIKGMGGKETASKIPGVAQFQNEEEIFLFLSEPGKSGYPFVVGAYQGKFKIHTDKRNNTKYVIDHTLNPPRRVDAEKFGQQIYDYAKHNP